MKTTYGTVRTGNITLLEGSSSDSENEDGVKIHPEIINGQPRRPTHPGLKPSLNPIVNPGVTKVDWFFLKSFPSPCFFTYIPSILIMMTEILERNISPQDDNRKQVLPER